jgi:hypothetical protein
MKQLYEFPLSEKYILFPVVSPAMAIGLIKYTFVAAFVEVVVRRLAKLLTGPPPAIKLEAPNTPVEVDTVNNTILLYGAVEYDST